MGCGSRGPSRGAGTHSGSRGVGLGHGREPEADVAHLARDRSLHRHHLHEQGPFLRLGGVPGGHPAEGRPDGGASAAPGGDAERAANVVAVRDRPDPGRHARRRPARRPPAGHALGVPGVAGEAAQGIVGERPERELRGVGPADDHRARPLEVARDRGIVRRDDPGEPGHAVRVRLPGHVHVLLDGHRDAVERTGRHAGPERGVQGARGIERALAEVDGHRVETRVDGPEPLAMRLDDVRTGQPPGARRPRRLDRAHPPDRLHGSPLPPGCRPVVRPPRAGRTGISFDDDKESPAEAGLSGLPSGPGRRRYVVYGSPLARE